MKKYTNLILLLLISFACSINETDVPVEISEHLSYGSDFSIMKRMEDFGGEYKIDGVSADGFYIFKKNGFTWARLRLFHTPNMKGAVCNNLEYTLEMAKKANNYGFRVLLNFHYSDTWADPGHQSIPAAWEGLDSKTLADSVYNYTKKVIEIMGRSGVMPDMVQIGNEINNGMLWPNGQLWFDGGIAKWENLVSLLKAGIQGVKDASGARNIPVMIHAATGGSLTASQRFYNNIIERGVDFEVIGISYYPWWHGSFDKLGESLYAISKNFSQKISIVETAYYSNGWYPEAGEWVIHERPFPPNETGQYNFMLELVETLKQYPKVETVFYWKPDELDIPESKVPYLGRSLFDKNGNARLGITAWKE